MTEARLLKLLEQAYGIKGKLHLLYSEKDKIYRLDSGKNNTSRYIIKQIHPTVNVKHLQLQHSLINSLSQAGVPYQLPQSLQTIDGDVILKSDDHYWVVQNHLDGVLMANATPIMPTTRNSIGRMLAGFQKVFTSKRYDADIYPSKWDNDQAGWLSEHLDLFERRRPLVERNFKAYLNVEHKISKLRKSICYNDANEHNIFLQFNREHEYLVSGCIDFGDAIFTSTINEVAIASAYAMMNVAAPLTAAGDIVEGFYEEFEILDDELELLFILIKTRLLVSLTHATINAQLHPDNEYLQISADSGWRLLEKLDKIHPNLAHYYFRSRCNKEPVASNKLFKSWAKVNQSKFYPLFGKEIHLSNSEVLDLSVGSKFLGSLEDVSNTAKFTAQAFELLDNLNKQFGIGRYDEIRLLYNAETFNVTTNDGPEWRTLHIGLDIFTKAYTPLYAPLDGEVVVSSHNMLPKDYGNVIVLKHHYEDECFFTLYGHLSNECTKNIRPGDFVTRGQQFARLGNYNENGDWVPHVHFQIILDILDSEENYIGVANPYERNLWLSLCPDPNIIVGIKGLEQRAYKILPTQHLIAIRKRILGTNLSISYAPYPLQILRGQGVYLFDHFAQTYLDMVNNVAHVGHENPSVVKAGQDQMAVLNTNTRYIHPTILDYADALLETLPDHLEVIYFTNSGSEANELALRMAKSHTGNEHIIVFEQGYHGNTQNCINVSSYKFDNSGGKGTPNNVSKLPLPDVFRGQFRGANAAHEYLQECKSILEKLQSKGTSIAGFIGESILSCGGQIVPPKDFYKDLYPQIHDYGGICIADEVQTGFGRVGQSFWSFQLFDVNPDIVTMGKPIGNGHPLGAVATTREIAKSFDNGMEYFNTFGGNPVSCAIGQSVLQYIQDHDLQKQAKTIGDILIRQLTELKERYPFIGDVRGSGLFLGIEIIQYPDIVPDAERAKYIVRRMRQNNILLSTDGPDHNVIKIKPPMLFNEDHINLFMVTLNKILVEDYLHQ
ncbi:MAG: aminotransferase class III-fold pyridoxal phosphate-dependent enzyme [Bacteroidia bacterium]|nr:aminotransferase class III-fold pyridoxal phosphate-dependent enzyme [Bacteroidia bacterium]